MKSRLLVPVLVVAFALTAIIGSIAIGDAAKEGAAKESTAPAAEGVPEFHLPPGWTEADMQACMLAGTPGEMHKFLVNEAGKWKGKHTMWMYPGAEPMTTEATCAITPIMDGRFVQIEWTGEIPGMGPYKGLGINGYDNVSESFSAIWLDNHGTGMMNGEGKLSKDGKTLTWKFNYQCPITRKGAVMKQVETFNDDGSKVLDMFGPDPKTGKEFQMMRIEMTRIGGHDSHGHAESHTHEKK